MLTGLLKKVRGWSIVGVLIIAYSLTLWSQDDVDPQKILGDIIENLETDDAFEQNTILEQLEGLLARPLDLNKADAETLQDFVLLSPIQVSSLMDYRAQFGDLLSIYELQTIPNWDLETIRRIRPFVSVAQTNAYGTPTAKEVLNAGEHTIFIGGNRTLEDKKGYIRDDGGGYFGDPWRKNLRYRFNYANRISAGFNIESDAGEPFLSNQFLENGDKVQNIDYLSFHFYMRDQSKIFKTLAIGDYDINLGQGLTMFNGFAPGKSAFVMDIKRSGRTIRPHTSNEEIRFLRGAAATMAISENLDLTAFVSSRNRDGNQISIETDTAFDAVSSLQASGLHRTENEIIDRGAVKSTVIGGKLEYQMLRGDISANFYSNSFDKPFQRRFQLYNQFLWNGDQLSNYSIDYNYRIKGLTFFGESAISSNGGHAHHHNVLMGLSEFASAALSYRNFSRDYTTLYPGAFAESTAINNEKGLYLALDIRPSYNWIISGYVDLFQYPWLRFSVDGPSEGHEYLVRTTYRIKRKLEAYLQWREEVKFRNFAGNETPIDFLVANEKTNLRAHVAWKIYPSWEIRTRGEYVWWDEQQGQQDKGLLLYQDLIFNSINFPVSFRARYAWFETDGFDTRIYTYENDLIYNFSIPAFADHGSRAYINLRYDVNRSITAEARIAQTYFRNRDTISSGNEEIEGNKRTDFKFQLRFRW